MEGRRKRGEERGGEGSGGEGRGRDRLTEREKEGCNIDGGGGGGEVIQNKMRGVVALNKRSIWYPLLVRASELMGRCE